ncbi:MAG: hypothetical protein EAX96_06495 [Candidatus Lokiarchaeota archaeon]|nr:hypothetical protein [Candidatus Lokiarchaeota archaeon]
MISSKKRLMNLGNRIKFRNYHKEILDSLNQDFLNDVLKIKNYWKREEMFKIALKTILRQVHEPRKKEYYLDFLDFLLNLNESNLRRNLLLFWHSTINSYKQRHTSLLSSINNKNTNRWINVDNEGLRLGLTGQIKVKKFGILNRDPSLNGAITVIYNN